MKATRRLTRAAAKRAESKKSVNYKLRKSNLLHSLALAALLSAPVIGLWPDGAEASIVALDNSSTKVTVNNNVSTVTTTQVVDTNSIAQYSQFVLDSGNIANLVFTTDNLFNLVYDTNPIKIDGIVNAIKKNQMGGNLYFLNPNGMVIGANGVINAGSVHIAAVTPEELKTLGDINNSTQDLLNKYTNGTHLNEVPINPEGTITVLGRINANDGIDINAPSIQIGGIDATTGQAYNTVLQTGVVDFSSFVNFEHNGELFIPKEENKVTMKLEKAGTGDIYLTAAVTDELNYQDTAFAANTAEAVSKGEGNNGIKVNIEQQSGLIAAAGDVVMKATATSQTHAVTETIADINVDGKITGKDIKISAIASNIYVDGMDSDIKTDGTSDSTNQTTATTSADNTNTTTGGTTDNNSGNVTINNKALDKINSAVGVFTINLDANYAVLAGEAKVNIGENAELIADSAKTANDKGNGIAITADSTVMTAVGATTAPFKLANIKNTNVVPGTAVTYVEASNKAEVNIAGKISNINAESKDAVINASATMEVNADASSTTTAVKGQANVVNAALLIVNADNNAAVNIEQTADLADITANKLDISSNSHNSLTATANVSNSDAGALAAAINIVNYDSSATTNIQGSVGANDLNISANNLIEENTVKATNKIGTAKMQNKLMGKLMSTDTFKVLTDGESSVLGHIIDILPNKLQQKLKTPAEDNALNKIGEYISAGASVGYVDENNSADVIIGNKAELTADNNLNIQANMQTVDTTLSVSGDTNTHKKEKDVEVSVNAAVLVSDVSNTSNVTIEGGAAEGDHAVLNAGHDLTIEANTLSTYNATHMLSQILDSKEQLSDLLVKVGGDLPDLFDKIVKSYDELKEIAIDFSTTADDDLAGRVSTEESAAKLG